MTPKSVAFHTLGCKLNYSETSTIARMFEEKGFLPRKIEDGPDIFVLNTCSVTEGADKECRKIVRSVLRTNPQTQVVVIGCYAQLKPSEISEIPGVDLVLGAAEKFKILEFVENLEKSPGKGLVAAGEVRDADIFSSSFSFGDRTRSFLKVQDGCDYKCTFCTIPQARGASRSDTVENAVKNAREIGERGVREIVLTGVNLGDFGNGTQVIEGVRPRKNALFVDLIRELDRVENIDRFRISSIEPNLLTAEIIDFVADSRRFMPHFHVPLQSGSNKILAAMSRRYRRELYAERVELIKKTMPHACIGVDVIVGFPGETDADFEETYRFLVDLDVSYLHVFTYSERANTPAASMPNPVSVEIRRERNARLRTLSEKKRRSFYEPFLGKTRPVLFELSKNPAFLSGFTDNYLKIEIPFEPDLLNTIQPVLIKSFNPEGDLTTELSCQMTA
jgi:threonylcarbamoyladenosine tRNA methylthiotransferase MtaB